MKFHFIINPTSGSYSYQEVVDYIRLFAQKNKEFEYDLHLTEYAGHAKVIAQSIFGNDQCVVAVGGDGTINEALNGLNEGVKLAGVPIGSGNDFVKMLNYPKKLTTQEWIEETITGRVIKIDVGLANGERFINSCNTGLDANVLKTFNKMRNWPLPNNIVYLLSTFKTILKPSINLLRIKIDDEKEFEHETLLCTIMNGKYYGNGYTPTPDAEIQDGIFDLCLVKNLSLFKISRLINKYSKGTHTKYPAVTMKLLKKIRIESDDPILYALDGELRESEALDCQVNDHQIEFVVSQKAEIY